MILWAGREHYCGWLSLSISAYWKWLPEVQGWHLEGPEGQGQGPGGVWPASKPLGIQPGAHRHPPAGSHPESHQMTPGREGEETMFSSSQQRPPTHLHHSSSPGKARVGTGVAAPGTHWWTLNQLIICHHLYSQVLHL